MLPITVFAHSFSRKKNKTSEDTSYLVHVIVFYDRPKNHKTGSINRLLKLLLADGHVHVKHE